MAQTLPPPEDVDKAHACWNKAWDIAKAAKFSLKEPA